MTLFLGDILINSCGVTPKQDWQWEETKAFNEHIWKNFQLHNEIDVGEISIHAIGRFLHHIYHSQR